MAAKKNPKPLNILVTPSNWRAKSIRALADKGHNVIVMGSSEALLLNIEEYDIIFSEKAWRMTEDLAETSGLPQVAVTAARAVKFRRAKKTKEEDDDDEA